MNRINIKQHIIPSYLAIILLVMAPNTPIAILCVLTPLLIISTAIHFKNKTIGILGIFLLYLLALPQVMVSSMDDIILVLIFMSSLLLPSIILVSQILQDQNTELAYRVLLKRKKPVLISFGSALLLLVLFYGITLVFGDRLLLSTESIQGQVLLLTGLSLFILTPLLLKTS
jgi:hypothetical protein